MASFHAIAVTSLTLRGILLNAPSRLPGADVQLAQAKDLRSPGHLSYGLSIYFHRVAFGTSRRNLPPRSSPDGRRFRPPTPIDAHFLVIAWGRSPEQQQTLLGWAIRTLQDSPILVAGLLNSFAADAGDVFRESETVELVGELLSYQDLVSIWEIAKDNQQPCVPYVARMVLIESDIELAQGEPVQTRAFEYANRQ